jgi:hypothetical protein
MKKLAVVALVALSLLLTASVALAERDNIGGVSVTRFGPTRLK